MNYIDVAWETAEIADPYRLVSELDEHRFETRKLEFFRSGAVGSASSSHATTNTQLGSEAVPQLQEISADPRFSGTEVPEMAFELLWTQHGRTLKEYEIVDIVSSAEGLPKELVGSRAVVVLVHNTSPRPAYEVECVAADGSSLWLGALPREVLRAGVGNDV